MNPYENTAKTIIDTCYIAITGKEPNFNDPIVLVQYNKLKEDIVNLLLDFEVEIRKPIPL